MTQSLYASAFSPSTDRASDNNSLIFSVTHCYSFVFSVNRLLQYNIAQNLRNDQ